MQITPIEEMAYRHVELDLIEPTMKIMLLQSNPTVTTVLYRELFLFFYLILIKKTNINVDFFR